MLRYSITVVLLTCFYIELSEQITAGDMLQAGQAAAKSVATAPQRISQIRTRMMAKASRIKTKEHLLHLLHTCDETKDAGVIEIATEIYKYKDYKTGPKIREEMAEKCYESLRPKVREALAKGHIQAMGSCVGGWGSFLVYEKSKYHLFDIKKRFPC